MSSIPTPPCGPVLPLLAEELVVTRRNRIGDTVRVTTVTREQERSVDEALTHERVAMDRVAIGRVIDAVPPIRQDGDVTIIPVVEEEEVVVVQRRLILREEIHMRRVRVTERHRETVTVRRQDVDIRRIPGEGGHRRPTTTLPFRQQTRPVLSGDTDMTDETIVAIFDTAAQADAAVRDLTAAQVPADAISRHAGGTTTASLTPAPAQEQGFWASLFGGEPDHDEAVYTRSLEKGSTVVTVKVPEHRVALVTDILERHDPVDIDERASGYGLYKAGTTTAATAPPAAPAVATQDNMTGTPASTEGGSIQLSEEQLQVGKRAVNRGTTRVRRFVVETPVEEQVTLRGETVTVERRAVTGGGPVTNADFTEKTVEMTETDEEAIVGKTARVTEEVLLRKDATERVETVRDTVRREDVEIKTIPAAPTAPGL